MTSLIKMLRPSKKNNNKENVPAVSFATGSLKSKKSTLNESVYSGEVPKIDFRLKSPYAVITGPKTTKGPMSCPGAPLDDRSFRNSTRKVKDDSVLNRRSELVDDQAYRNMIARQQYDMSMSQQDDSDEEKQLLNEKYRQKKGEVTMLKAKIERMKVKWREDKQRMNETIDDLSNENYQIRKQHDRLRQKYSEVKLNIEVEKKTKSELLKMLQEATMRIEKLEKSGGIHDESLNNSSLLIRSYGDATMEMSSEGAGEALCFPDQNNQMTSMFMTQTSIFGSSALSTTSGHQNPKSLEDDLDAQDEVRVFRNSVEDIAEDEEMTEDEETEELELSSPFEVETARSSTRQIPKTPKKMTRAHSDSDIIGAKGVDTVSLAMEPIVQSQTIPPPPRYEQRQKYSRTNSWLKRNSVIAEDAGSSDDSSEEERLSLIDRQLKKKGGLVKYNPPRTKINEKHYKRFGKDERSALAEFEYLQDMSTDVSGLQSSPELGQLMGKLQQQRL